MNAEDKEPTKTGWFFIGIALGILIGYCLYIIMLAIVK